ncbi:MAG: ATP-binding protein [Bacillota bacterium]|nr:ATP-binding protein [Bacillota bacterium]
MKIGVKVHLIIAILAVVLISSLILIFQYIVIPNQVNMMIERSWNVARYIKQCNQYLCTEEQQELVEKLIIGENNFAYLVVLDSEGKAIVHSNPDRIGMVFNDTGTMAGIQSRMGKQQIYVRDAENEESPFHGERVIDVMLPSDSQGVIKGAVNVGLSLKGVDEAKQDYYFILLLSVLFLTGALLLLDFSLVNQVVIPLASIGQTNRDMQKALKGSEEKFSAAFRLSPEAISISSLADGRYIEVNDTWEDFYGYKREEVIGNNVHDFSIWVNPDERNLLLEELRYKPTVHSIEKEMCTKLEEHKHALCSFTNIQINGEPCVLFLSTDISLRKQLEEERLKASKLESLGVLAGGIAHDFNNLLTVIVGNLALAQMNLKERCEGQDEISELLVEAEKASFQARGLTQQLLTFAKGGAPVRETYFIKELIRDSAGFALCGSNVICEFRFDPNLMPVDMDGGQMSQVINNLIINAIQAMPNGGRIKITAENRALSGYEFSSLGTGDYVRIAIQDQGIGVPEKLQKRIFDPYFTTKVTGSGLGLATSYSIIRKHNGHIALESKPGEGTTFFIYLPGSQQEKRSGTNYETIYPGRGRILVMDDEERVREVAGQILDSIGYEVELTKDGLQALEIYQKAMEQNEPFDLVIMDLTIPGGMGGKETMQKLLETDPEVKVIVCSGYSNDPIMADYKAWGFKGVIAKPYGIRELSATIGRVING